jgi:hypothetical protein
MLDSARLLLPSVRDEYGRELATYVRLVTGMLARAGLVCSPRRAGMLLRNIAAVHTARYLLGDETDLAGSAWLALASSLPQRATGHTVKEIRLLAAHREAWNMAGLEANDPRRLILAEVDPLRRAMRAAQMRSPACGPALGTRLPWNCSSLVRQVVWWPQWPNSVPISTRWSPLRRAFTSQSRHAVLAMTRGKLP